MAGASNGDLAWNRFGETRLQLDVTYGGLRQLDIYTGGMYSTQQVRTWQRIPLSPRRRRRPPARGVRLPANERRRLRGGAGSRRRPRGHRRRALRSVQRRHARGGAGARRPEDAQPAVCRVHGAGQGYRRRELWTLHPGPGLSVPGGCRVRRYDAHRPLPPRQPGHRIREGHAIRVQRAGSGHAKRFRCAPVCT